MPDKLLSPEYGLSNSKLEECNTSSSDVRSGKTFYSGDTSDRSPQKGHVNSTLVRYYNSSVKAFTAMPEYINVNCWQRCPKFNSNKKLD